jgi:hypothetical protein
MVNAFASGIESLYTDLSLGGESEVSKFYPIFILKESEDGGRIFLRNFDYLLSKHALSEKTPYSETDSRLTG